MTKVKDDPRQVAAAHRALPPPAVCRGIRVAAGLPQACVAQALGVDRASVARWELGTRRPRGERLVSYVELLADLADVLDAVGNE